ncbi:MAG: stage II sporulation protein M [Gemmatimonadota bacterium]|nr:stage II sporulation protein M [Gemmatimonadota bacterium]
MATAAAHPTLARPFEQTVDVETPELVVLTYSVAGVGSRVLAGLTDLLICAGLLFVVTIAIVLLRGGFSLVGDRSASWGAAALLLAQFVVLWGYYVLFEGLMDGQTPGKRLHRLRVVRDGGYSVTFGVSAVRNLIRMLDMQPGVFYLVGLSSLFFTKRGRRLGDLVAGTIVVREDIRTVAAPARGKALPEQGAAALQTALSEDEYDLLGRFVARWSTLDPLRRAALSAQLVERFRSVLPDDSRAPGQRLLELHGREQAARTRGVASKGETGAGRERQALIAAGSPRWNRFASTLATAQKQGLSSLGEGGVREFVAEYRALSADLARLRTASGGRALDEMFFLGRLVAGAHNLLYRDRGMTLRHAVRYLFTDVPREVRQSVGPIALAAALLFGPAAITAFSVMRSPELASRLLPQSMLQRADDGVQRARSGEGYIDDPQLLRPVMASQIVTNNIQVTFAVFAGGITAGLLSVLMLVVNGISMGSVVGLYASKGIGMLLLAFIAPHGVLELFAICVAAGGGFLIASALLLPGARTRHRALVENGRRAARLIAASTFLLVIAGTLEGFISPIPWWPIEGKLAVSGATAVFLYLYLAGGRPMRQQVLTDNDYAGSLGLAPLSERSGARARLAT